MVDVPAVDAQASIHTPEKQDSGSQVEAIRSNQTEEERHIDVLSIGRRLFGQDLRDECEHLEYGPQDINTETRRPLHPG